MFLLVYLPVSVIERGDDITVEILPIVINIYAYKHSSYGMKLRNYDATTYSASSVYLKFSNDFMRTRDKKIRKLYKNILYNKEHLVFTEIEEHVLSPFYTVKSLISDKIYDEENESRIENSFSRVLSVRQLRLEVVHNREL